MCYATTISTLRKNWAQASQKNSNQKFPKIKTHINIYIYTYINLFSTSKSQISESISSKNESLKDSQDEIACYRDLPCMICCIISCSFHCGCIRRIGREEFGGAREKCLQLNGIQRDVNSSGVDAIRLSCHISATFLVTQTSTLPSIENVTQQQGNGTTWNVTWEEDLLPFLPFQLRRFWRFQFSIPSGIHSAKKIMSPRYWIVLSIFGSLVS